MPDKPTNVTSIFEHEHFPIRLALARDQLIAAIDQYEAAAKDMMRAATTNDERVASLKIQQWCITQRTELLDDSLRQALGMTSSDDER